MFKGFDEAVEEVGGAVADRGGGVVQAAVGGEGEKKIDKMI